MQAVLSLVVIVNPMRWILLWSLRASLKRKVVLSSQVIKCLGVLPPVRTARQQPIIPVVADLLIPVEEFL